MLKQKKLKSYQWWIFIILAIGSIAMLFPFIWMILSSFKTRADVYTYPPRWIPSTWNFDNYKKVFEMVPFMRYYFNSIFTSVMQTGIEIFISITAAYVLTRLDFPGKRGLITLVRSTMFVPMIVTLIPLYLMVSSLGLVDTYAGLIFPQVFSAFTIFLIMSFFMTIPQDLFDSAKLDGCGYFRMLWNVAIPTSRSAISTAVLFSFLGHWKSYTWPLIITNKATYRTLPIGLKYLVTDGQGTTSEYQIMMAASVMAILPVLIVFSLSEKQLVRSVTLTGLKS